MNTAKLKPILGRVFRYPHGVTLSPIPDRFEYEVIILCHRSAQHAIEQIIEQHLAELGGRTATASDELTSEGSLTRITARALCTIAERAQLVRLVTRLGF
ncbi:MAG: hypothetical protein NVSMB6_19320 [Burkholderiaceae bacterium]